MSNPRAPSPETADLIATPLRRQLDEILSARGAEREERLLNASELGAIVAMIPPEELFFTLQEMDPDDVPLVLAHARTEQVEFLLDLELWKKDRLKVDQVAPWLERLLSCGTDPVARWLRELDLADLALLLGQLAQVHVADDENDPLQDLPGNAPFTLDGVYYVSTPEDSEHLVRSILVTIRELNADHYYRLVEALIRDVDSELEEACYQERQKRLAERGFPEWEEAMEVYTRLDVDDPSALPERPDLSDMLTGPEPVVAPRYPIEWPENAPDLLVRALRRIESATALEAFRAELAVLTNKVAVADGLDLDRLDSFRLALQKVAACASIGLEALCGYDEQEAARVLERCWLQSVFRVGWTQVRRVRSQARRLFEGGWPQGRKERLLFLDPPLPEVLEGLLRPEPLWHTGDGEGAPYRLFRTLSEVDRAKRCIEKAGFLGRFLLTVVDLRLGDLKEALLGLDTENLSGSTVFLTAFVNAALGRDFRFAPVDRNAVRQGLARIWESDLPPRRVRPGLDESAVEWSRKLVRVSDREQEYLREFVGECFALLEEQFGHLAPDEIPDPRFTRGIWIE